MTQVFAGRYQLVDLLGRGGMGDVWRVWDLRDGVYRAAKLQRQADSASLLRFVRESSTRVEHPHVVAPTGWSAEDGTVLFAMPIIGGGSVAQVVADHGPLPAAWVREVGRQLFLALQAVHDAGLVHRDVKPANLLLEATGTAPPVLRLSDFGIAAVRDEPRLTRAWEVVHTPGYAAPEVFTDADPHPRQDLYAAGVVLVEMLTAERPRSDGSVVVPPGPFASVIARLVDPDPEQRYATAAEAGAALVAVPVPAASGEPVEVFSHLPEWPDGWGPGGPAGAAGRDEQPATSSPTGPGPTQVAATAVRETDPTRRRRVAPRQPLPAPPVAGPGVPREPAQGEAGSRRGTPVGVWLLGVAGLALVVAAVVTGLR
ncbi:MAG: protein kinase [Aeromicrobium sp.]|uniref:serine/threonine protein kinase n=1 Tax=Aeromicrobium sp. TaxID=1871063 RepID=UPI0025BBFEF9|nr:serine/threonine protein kinase [Aeromicrobium sp.]MDF1705377.1 protein kinase [Aeromicrobium sp.]